MLDHKLYIEEQGKFIASADFSVIDNCNDLIIIAHKNGDMFTRKMSNLDEELSAFVGTELYKKIERPTMTEYHFQLVKPERLYLTATTQKQWLNGMETKYIKKSNLGLIKTNVLERRLVMKILLIC